MTYYLEERIESAASLMGTPRHYGRYLYLTIHSGFCCSSHCPQAWDSLNEYLSPWGRLDEGKSILIEINNSRFIFEHHETGSEVVAYVALGTSSRALIPSIVELITALLKAAEAERSKQPQTVIIREHYFIIKDTRKHMIEQDIFDTTLPLSEIATKELSEALSSSADRVSNLSCVVHQPETRTFETVFELIRPSAKSVKVSGDFNKWQGNYMRQTGYGIWVARLELPEGKHHYKFIVDGEWIVDPENRHTETDEMGNSNSVIQVGQCS
jgi:hypothetical protein